MADSNGMEVHIDLGNVSQIVNENDIRSRIRNIRRFLSMSDARLNRLREIQSGAPLDDTPNSTIIVGSIQTTTALSDGNNIIGFETNSQNIRGPIDPRILSLAGVLPSSNQPTGQDSSSVQSPTETSDDDTATTTSNQPEQTTPDNTASGANQSIGVDVLAEMSQSVMDTYARFLPYFQQYHTMLLNDQNEAPESPNANATNAASSFNFANATANNPNVILLGGDNRRQRFCNNINDMMHLLGHLFHNLSDLHVNIRDRPPRQMHTMSSMSHASSAIIGTAVPVEATIQIPLHVGTGTASASLSSPSSNQIFVHRRPRSTLSQPSQQSTTTDHVHRTAEPQQQQQQHVRSMPNQRNSNRSAAGPSFGNYSTANSYDQYLPCNSVHFYNSYQPGQTRRRPNEQTGAAQPNDISRLLTNFLSSGLSRTDAQSSGGDQSTRAHGRDTSETTTPAPQTPTSTPLINSPRGSSANMAAAGSMPFFSNPFGQLFAGRTNQDRLTGAILGEALNLMSSSNNQNDSRLNQPLRDLMRMFATDDDQDENLTNSSTGQPSMVNSFSIFFQSLTIRDMIDLARGVNRHRVFERTRQPLRQYILDNLNLSNETLFTSAHSAQMANRFYTDIVLDQNGLNVNFDQFELTDETIDLAKSIENVFKANIRNILDHLFDESYPNTSDNESERTWSLVLFEHFKTLLDQVVNLMRACVRNADTKLLQLAVDKIRTGLGMADSGSIGALIAPLEVFIRNHVQEILNRVATDRSQVQNLIVYKQDEQQSVLNNEEEMRSIESGSSETASSTLSGSTMDIDESFAQKDARRIRAEWLPVLEHDNQKQVENRDRNFSDAYCSGMPAKKRRILSSKNDLLKENLFKRVLQRTLENNQLKSDAQGEDMIEQTLKKSQLIDYFDEEFDLAITERLRNDSDLMEIVKCEDDASDNQTTDDTLIYNKPRYSNSRKRLK